MTATRARVFAPVSPSTKTASGAYYMLFRYLNERGVQGKSLKKKSLYPKYQTVQSTEQVQNKYLIDFFIQQHFITICAKHWVCSDKQNRISLLSQHLK